MYVRLFRLCVSHSVLLLIDKFAYNNYWSLWLEPLNLDDDAPLSVLDYPVGEKVVDDSQFPTYGIILLFISRFSCAIASDYRIVML